MKSTIFNSLHSKYYDLTYEKKDYSEEVVFFDSLILKYGRAGTKTLVSLGAGTLNHERLLSKKGYSITGIDFSEQMVALALQKIKEEKIKNITIRHGDMRSWTNGKKFDAALSMFNVISYCKNLKEFEQVVITAKNALAEGGVFIFDCWNAEAVKKDPPKTRFAKFRRGDIELYRLTEATPRDEGEAIDLDIELIEIKNGNIIGRETETHRVHAWHVHDIKKILEKNGFSLSLACQLGDEKLPVSDQKWAMTVVAKKV